MQYQLTVADFSDDQVVLRDEKGNLIYWPKDKLPQVPELGEKIVFSIGADDGSKILNELLKTDN